MERQRKIVKNFSQHENVAKYLKHILYRYNRRQQSDESYRERDVATSQFQANIAPSNEITQIHRQCQAPTKVRGLLYA